MKKLTVTHFKKKNKDKISALAVYDYSIAKFADESEIDLLLIGDSLGMTIQGHKNTVPVTLEQSLYHSTIVGRAVKRAFVIGDMPFMTYQISPEQAMANAARYLQEALVDGVKVEGGVKMAKTIERLVETGIPVMGHIGLLPQNVLTTGGYFTRGKTDEDIQILINDAKALESAGAFSIVLECVTIEGAQEITNAINIPTIGIGAGIHCDGQIQVVHDILGLIDNFTPKHAKQYINLSTEIKKTFTLYNKEIKDQSFPSDAQSISKN